MSIVKFIKSIRSELWLFFVSFWRPPAFAQFSTIIVAGFTIELEEIADNFTSHSPSLTWDENNRNLMSTFLVFFELRNAKGGYFKVVTMKIHLQFLIENFFIITVSVKFIQNCIKFLWEINLNSEKKFTALFLYMTFWEIAQVTFFEG